MPAGYSGTPLAKKLGVRSGDTVVLIGAPDGFEHELDGLPDDVTVKRRSGGKPDVVILFTTKRADLERRFEPLAQSIFPDGSVWIAWPKKSSGVSTDVDENVLRDVGLPYGLVDNKVCAVNEIWSGLRFVWRKERRISS